MYFKNVINDIVISYIYDDTGISGAIYKNQKYKYIKNILGDIILIVNESLDVICEYRYTAYGAYSLNDLSTINSIDSEFVNYNPFTYRGYYKDHESNLYYLINRYYSPDIEMFITPDSFAFLDPSTLYGLDLYTYCMFNPVMYVDPEGNMPEWAKWAIGIGVCALIIVASICTAGAIISAAPAIAGVAKTMAMAYTLSYGLANAAAMTVSVGAAVLAVSTVAIGVNEGISYGFGRNFGEELFGQEIYSCLTTIVGIGTYAYLVGGAIYPYPSTERKPENLNEQIVMKDAMTHSVDDKKIKNTDDTRFPGWLGWTKYSHRDKPSKIEIHYIGNRYFPRWYPFSPWFDFKVKDN